MIVATFLYAGLVPLAVAAIFGCIAIALRATPQIAWPLSAALGFIAGLVALKSQSGFVAAVDEFANPHESANWLPAIVGLAAGVSVLLAIPRCRNVAVCLAAFLVLAAPIRLLSGNVRLSGGWSLAEKIEYLVLLVATFGGVWAALANGDRVRQSPARFLFLMITAVGTAAALTLSGVLVYGQACGALAASLAGVAISQLAASWWGSLHAADYVTPAQPKASAPLGLASTAGIVTLSLGSLIVLGHFFADLSAPAALLLFISLTAAGTPVLESVLPRPAWQLLAIRSAACLLPLAIAIQLCRP
jgi:hypothetical protein